MNDICAGFLTRTEPTPAQIPANIHTNEHKNGKQSTNEISKTQENNETHKPPHRTNDRLRGRALCTQRTLRHALRATKAATILGALAAALLPTQAGAMMQEAQKNRPEQCTAAHYTYSREEQRLPRMGVTKENAHSASIRTPGETEDTPEVETENRMGEDETEEPPHDAG